jgi:[protein-PII] uridylyltransferase
MPKSVLLAKGIESSFSAYPPGSTQSPAPPAGPEPGFDLSWQARRQWFRARLAHEPLSGGSPEEIAAHFDCMPAYYWERVNLEDLVWGLTTIRSFFKLLTAPGVSPTTPILDCRQLPHRGLTRVMLCTWDRHGLLAKAAAAFSAARLNILEADVFTRSDNVVLDVFWVADSDGRGGATPRQLEEMSFLVEGALSQPPRFASVWACLRHKYLAPPSQFPARITFDNFSSPASTLVRVEATDRLGLLYDILQAVADTDLTITQARIQTENKLAHDLLQVTDAQGGKVVDALHLEDLRRNIESALAVT